VILRTLAFFVVQCLNLPYRLVKGVCSEFRELAESERTGNSFFPLNCLTPITINRLVSMRIGYAKHSRAGILARKDGLRRFTRHHQT